MSLLTSLGALRRRLIDALGGGAVFSGAGGAAVALLRPDGRVLRLSTPAIRMFADAAKAETLDALFMPDDRARVDQAVRSKAVGRVEARARRPGGVRGRRCRVELGHMPVDVLLVLTTPATIKMM